MTGALVWATCLLLFVSLVAVMVAPLLMPGSYSCVSHTISESAAQGVPHAWVARLGFVCLGMGAIAAALNCRHVWGLVGAGSLVLFGAFIICSAVVSEKPWQPGVAFDPRQARLHSVAAGSAGVAYTVGVASVLIVDSAAPGWLRAFTAVAATSAVVAPLGMVLRPRRAGLLQRAMFALAYLWLAVEASGVR